MPSPAPQWEARPGTFSPTRRPKAPRQQLPADPAPANRPGSSQPAQQAPPRSRPGKAAHAPAGERRPPAGCRFPPPSLRCQARGVGAGFDPPCAALPQHSPSWLQPSCGAASRASQLLRAISDPSTPAWHSTAPTPHTHTSTPAFGISSGIATELAGRAECGAWHVRPRQSSSQAPRCPCLHGDEGETKHKQGGQLLGHSQAARASPYCWGTSGGAAVTMCPRGR